MSTITLDEALKLFEFPRNIGEFEGDEVVVAIGRFGPYVRHQGKFVSIPKEIAPAALSLDEAIELITEKRQAEEKKIVKVFDEDPEMRILNGRYGVYIAHKKDNFKIPRTVADPAALTYAEVIEIINSQDSKPKKTRTTAARKKSK